MKTLLLLRHGKSSWRDDSLADHDRPLKKRGRRASQQVGRMLVERQLVPDLILASTAIRAHDTAVLVAEVARYRGAIEAISDLYHAEPAAFVAVVSQIPKEIGTLLVVGHNPGLQEWLFQLTGSQHEFPTAALAQIELSMESWKELTLESHGVLHSVWRPRDAEGELTSE